jgi:phage gp29-like protein
MEFFMQYNGYTKNQWWPFSNKAQSPLSQEGSPATGDAPAPARPSAERAVRFRNRATMGRVSETVTATGTEATFGSGTFAFPNTLTPAMSVESFAPGNLNVFVQMQRDPQVRACLTTKRLSVLSEQAEVHPGIGDTVLAKQAASQVEQALQNVTGGVLGIVTGALDALAMGYSVGELVWSEAGNLARVLWHDPRRFTFTVNATGQVAEVVFRVGGEIRREPAERFVLWAYQGRYGNPYGESDLMAAHRPWAQKDAVQKMWLSALDRFGAPIPVARVPQNWNDADVAQLSALLARLQNESSLVLSQEVEISTPLDATRTEPARAFHTAAQWCDTQIARAILGQELTSQSGGGSGSYALGRVHEAVADDWIQSLRAEIAQKVLTEQIAKPLTVALVGPNAPVPRITFPNLNPSELEARRALVGTLISGGVVNAGEAWLRRYLGLPEANGK